MDYAHLHTFGTFDYLHIAMAIFAVIFIIGQIAFLVNIIAGLIRRLN
jgi:hypothetical protein